MPSFTKLKPEDNVLLALENISAGDNLGGVLSAQRVPSSHKIAALDIAKDQAVIKYGHVIGYATADIAQGSWVHEHNLYVPQALSPKLSSPTPPAPPGQSSNSSAKFYGFQRANGSYGTRNYLAVLTSVNCSATVAKFIANEINNSGVLADYPNIDGIISLAHGTGCGLATQGAAHELLKRTQWGYASNPNVGGVLIVGLGCETFQIPNWMEAYGLQEGPCFRKLVIQEMGGTAKTVAAGVEAIHGMLEPVNAIQRVEAPASELVLALQCGGSDAYSGITANPALGVAADLLVADGGCAILAETPEIYGAEHLLMQRATSKEIADKLAERISWWENYTARHDMEMNNNPSPGNKMGGLTTILEKSLGAVAKGGSSALREVVRYAEAVSSKGLVFMDTPGYDPVSATGQVAGGANIMCFTTGRGSAFGCKPTPCLKLASNNAMYAKMRDDMDINCGDILDGVSYEVKGREIYDHILATASGAPSKSELLGYGDNEFVPWQIGATM